MIVFKNVSKKFGEITVLEGVSFKIEDSEFAFITGPSGAGKTTVLRLILREVLPSSGEIFFNSQNVNNLPKSELPPYRRKLGVAFQDFKLLFDRTIGENVGLSLAVLGLPEEKQREHSRKALSYVGLEERFDSFPSQLAGGELQRAVLARALVSRPKLLLADEPTGNLDLDTAWEIMELMSKINQDGTTILMATHNRNIVDRMKHRVIELKAGKVIRDKQNGKYKE